jgi:hypothetical protein
MQICTLLTPLKCQWLHLQNDDGSRLEEVSIQRGRCVCTLLEQTPSA